MKFTAETILLIAPGADPKIVADLVTHQGLLEDNGIVTREETAHFLGQCACETQGFRRLEENLNYTSAKRIVEVWPSRFPTVADAEPYVRNPSGLANKVYGKRFGNSAIDDGWKFRGSGMLQTTFHDNFAEVERVTGVQCVANPDLLRKLPDALKAAVVYWKVRNLNTYAHANDVAGLTRAIQGGNAGLTDRRLFTSRALHALDTNAPPVIAPATDNWLRKGARGVEVSMLQLALQIAGTYGGTADGVFGDGTERAVVDFQKANGLTVDGVVGPKTRDALHLGAGPINASAQTGQGRPVEAIPVQPNGAGLAGLLGALLRVILMLFGKGK